MQATELDRQLRAWGAPVEGTAGAAEPALQGRPGLAGRITARPLQTIVWPAALAGLALCLASLRYGLEGLYRLVAVVLARLGPMP